jgi:hypothetical protein
MKFSIEISKSHHGWAPLLASLILPALLPACGSSGNPDSGTANAYIKNENNYRSTDTLTIPQVATAPGVDLHVCWTTLSTDLLNHALDPVADIDSVTFLQIGGLTEKQIATQFAASQFETNQVKLYRTFLVDHTAAPPSTCADLSAFKLGGAKLVPAQDYVVAADTKYLLLFAQGATPGVGSKSMIFLEPTAGATNTSVAAPEGSSILAFTADLTTPQRVSIPTAGPYVIDWSQLTQDGLGNQVIYQKIDGLFLGYYEMTIADLQARCLDFDRIATAKYTVSVPTGAKKMDLASAKTDQGEPFTGFAGRTSGLWGVALMCSACQSPAPIAVVILNPPEVERRRCSAALDHENPRCLHDAAWIGDAAGPGFRGRWLFFRDAGRSGGRSCGRVYGQG